MKRRLYTHEELIIKLEGAQNEIKRLKSRPNHAKIIKELIQEINTLRELNDSIVKQRNDLWKCLKLRHEDDGLL